MLMDSPGCRATLWAPDLRCTLGRLLNEGLNFTQFLLDCGIVRLQGERSLPGLTSLLQTSEAEVNVTEVFLNHWIIWYDSNGML